MIFNLQSQKTKKHQILTFEKLKISFTITYLMNYRNISVRNTLTDVNISVYTALLYEQLNAKFEPCICISDGELKRLIVTHRADSTHVWITVPRNWGASSLYVISLTPVTGIDLFDTPPFV